MELSLNETVVDVKSQTQSLIESKTAKVVLFVVHDFLFAT